MKERRTILEMPHMEICRTFVSYTTFHRVRSADSGINAAYKSAVEWAGRACGLPVIDG